MRNKVHLIPYRRELSENPDLALAVIADLRLELFEARRQLAIARDAVARRVAEDDAAVDRLPTAPGDTVTSQLTSGSTSQPLPGTSPGIQTAQHRRADDSEGGH